MTTAQVHTPAQAKTASLIKLVAAMRAALIVPAIRVQRMVMGVSLAALLVRIHRNYRSRQQLSALSAHLLADIGLTEEQRQAELRKPLWKTQGPE